MRLGRNGRRRSRAAIDRRFTIARVGGDALRFAMRPKSILFLGFIGLLSFTGEPLVRYLSHHPYFAIREVVISGTERLDEARVRSWLGMVEGKSIWQATPKDLEEVLRQRAVVADAHVRRRLPDRIEIVVEERQAGAIVRDARGFFIADDEGVLFELAQRRDHREAPNKLGDQTELAEIGALDLLDEIPMASFLLLLDRRSEAHGLGGGTSLDDLLDACERASTDEEDVRGVHLQEVLLGMLPSTLGRHRGDRPLQDLQERLLHPLARDVAGDRGVVTLSSDLVDLVDVNDSTLRPLDVMVSVLQQAHDDVLYILADIPSLRERGGVRYRERDVEDSRQRLRQESLAAAGRTEQQDVRFLELDVVLRDP